LNEPLECFYAEYWEVGKSSRFVVENLMVHRKEGILRCMPNLPN